MLPLCSNALLPPPFPILEALFKGSLWYYPQAIHRINHYIFHYLKSSSFKGNFEFREQERVRRGEVR
jgi:hypothetical protein